MNGSEFYSQCPVVRTERIELFRFADLSGTGRGLNTPVRFAEDIVWIRETESSIHYMHGGKAVMDGGAFSDFYGLGTSMAGALEAAQESCMHYKVSRDSSLSIMVVSIVRDIPALRIKDDVGTGPRRKYQKCPDDWAFYIEGQFKKLSAAGTFDERIEVMTETPVSLLCPVVVFEAKVWASDASDEDNQSAQELFRAKCFDFQQEQKQEEQPA